MNVYQTICFTWCLLVENVLYDINDWLYLLNGALPCEAGLHNLGCIKWFFSFTCWRECCYWNIWSICTLQGNTKAIHQYPCLLWHVNTVTVINGNFIRYTYFDCSFKVFLVFLEGIHWCTWVEATPSAPYNYQSPYCIDTYIVMLVPIAFEHNKKKRNKIKYHTHIHIHSPLTFLPVHISTY